ncbi:redox-regulated ATPase YchF [candidate division KSB1 bacterium]|nr:redox-regulated ATPase YchF [candidate division KSB1 bacterium]
MKIGLIGLANSGKTTIFNALTRQHAEVTAYASTKSEPNMAVVNVGDERVDRLVEIYKPKRTVHATVEVMDFVGLTAGSAKDGAFTSNALQNMKNADALALVVRNFHDDLMGDASPLDDAKKVAEELLIADLILAETRIERIEKGVNRGPKTIAQQIEETAIRKIADHLNEMKPVRTLELTTDEEKAMRGFQFLTHKPLMLVLNSAEDRFNKDAALLTSLGKIARAIEFAGNFEMELSRLDDLDEIKMFMDDMGIVESARDLLTQMAYELLGYISFFTVGPDEVRAWNIRKGDKALDAAGAIHTDLARGFIRAECFHYEDLIEFGSEKALKDNGRFRLEGKEYLVKDGDILSIRFNV